MRTEFIVFVFALFFADILAVPETKLQVTKNCKSAAQSIISWIVSANITGEDAWVLQMHSHLDCSKCALFSEKKLEKWPSNCKTCTDLYWHRIKHWKSCSSCHKMNWYCDTCRKHFTKAMATYKTQRDKLMDAYLYKIQYV